MKKNKSSLIIMGLLVVIILTGCKRKATSSKTKASTKPENIHEAAEQGDKLSVEKFLAQGTDINCRDRFGNTPLHYACLEGKKAVVEFLIRSGANINVRNLDGRTPIYCAIYDGYKEIVAILVGRGANINTKDNNRLITPLHTAVIFAQPEILELLLSNGADIGAKDNNRKTPLDQAIILSETQFRRGSEMAEKKNDFEKCVEILREYVAK